MTGNYIRTLNYGVTSENSTSSCQCVFCMAESKICPLEKTKPSSMQHASVMLELCGAQITGSKSKSQCDLNHEPGASLPEERGDV